MKKWFSQLGKNFKKTSSNIKKSIFSTKLDNTSIEDIEEAFLLSDLGVNYTNLLIEEIKKKKFDKEQLSNQIAEYFEKQFDGIENFLELSNIKGLKVILVFGVNGSGKTTTLAKLASKANNEGVKVLMVAADIFERQLLSSYKAGGRKLE